MWVERIRSRTESDPYSESPFCSVWVNGIEAVEALNFSETQTREMLKKLGFDAAPDSEPDPSRSPRADYTVKSKQSWIDWATG